MTQKELPAELAQFRKFIGKHVISKSTKKKGVILSVSPMQKDENNFYAQIEIKEEFTIYIDSDMLWREYELIQ